VLVEVLSIQASKQPETIYDALKMQRVLFYKSHDIENKLLIIIHVDKMSDKKEINFSQTKPRAFSRALHFETYKNRRSPHDVPSPMVISRTYKQIISFPRKITMELQDFKKQIVLNSHRFFLFFFKCKINISRFFLDNYSFTKLKRREWLLETIICLSR
jgi:hypothetical protein